MNKEPGKEIRHNGKIATLRRARTSKKCVECVLPIPVQTRYYSVVNGGGGLGSLKYPDAVHIECIRKHFNKQRDIPR